MHEHVRGIREFSYVDIIHVYVYDCIACNCEIYKCLSKVLSNDQMDRTLVNAH